MFSAILAIAIVGQPIDAPKGTLVAVGGGSTIPAITRRTLDLAGGAKAKVLVVPQASERADAGSSSAAMWRDLGVQNVSVLELQDAAAAVQSIRSADLIWMPGGDQNRLMRTLATTGVPDAIRERYRAGATVGGTSAGAALLSHVMITGQADLERIRRGATQTADGLNVWPNAIVDQHFVRRQRFIRLLSAVIDRPQLVGVGIDESTAAIVRGSVLEVVGAGQVLVIDGRSASIPAANPGDLSSATGMRLHVLTSGMTFDLERK
jgi:cyanophycinase